MILSQKPLFQAFVFLFAVQIVFGPNLSWAEEKAVWHKTTSLIGKSKYLDDFTHYDYVNPDAPKGGVLNTAVQGTYDSFNPFIVKGTAAVGLTYFGGFLWDTLMSQGIDESSVSHPLIATEFSFPRDYSSATYRLNKNARWHDGKPITAEDVKWSMEILREHSPQHVRYFANIKEVIINNPLEVTFVFDQKGNRELPHIMGDLPILPKHWWEGKNSQGKKRDITQPTLEPPLGNGPYKISKFQPGSTIEWERVKDYWAKDTPTRKGRYNVDLRKYTYFGDDNAMFIAFQKGGINDIRDENQAKRWAIEYVFPAVKNGRVIKEEFIKTSSYPMVGWVLNARRGIFKDVRVRKALNLAFNFEQMNRDLFYDQYSRTATFFGGTEMSSKGIAKGRELEILREFKGKIPDEIFATEYKQPNYLERKDKRANLKVALGLLKQAGWVNKGGVLTNEKTGKPFAFEIMGNSPASERVNAPWINSLKLLGIKASFRVVDTAQFIQRQRNFNYDVITAGAYQSASPGNEQRDYWTSKAADTPGSRNWAGIKDPVIDELVDRIIAAKDRTELVATTRALDRVLLFQHYYVLRWYLAKDRVAYWDKFVIPREQPTRAGYDPESWWIDPDKVAALKAKSN